MKKIFLLSVILFLLAFLPLHLTAQDTCDISIGTNFSSDCLLTWFDTESANMQDENTTDCLVACRGSIVEYYASSTVGGTYSWDITGADSYSILNYGRTARVTWGSGETGNVSVTLFTADISQICTETVCVLLMESPIASCSTVSTYYINAVGEKVIEICLGETIYLTDASIAGDNPITGHYWETEDCGTSSMPDFSVTPVTTGEFDIIHKVSNDCGCEGKEFIHVVVNQPIKLDLSCYGTVCANSTATYTLNNPSCSEYHWHVDGGSISDGDGTPTITVSWGDPASGYGALSIDGSFCDTECDALVPVRIPIIGDNVEIEGPEDVCVGDIKLFELPLWGSTSYTWSITNTSAGFEMHTFEYPNQRVIEFRQAGTYIIKCDYDCDFIPCGPYSSLYKTVRVKDTLSIISEDGSVCIGDTGIFTTDAAVTAVWAVLSSSGQTILTDTTDTFRYAFISADGYLITASHTDYCNTAEFAITVRNTPPAPMSVTGKEQACPFSSILLSATPTLPNYYLEWTPLCATANLDLVCGDSVTINYGSEVCDVAVFQVDNQYGCRSEAFIHEVDTFRLLSDGFPLADTLCMGDSISFSVPDQSSYGVTYEWTISPANVATVVGNNLSSSVTILANYLLSGQTSYTALVTLKRRYCSDWESNINFVLTVGAVQTPQLTFPDAVQAGTSVTLLATPTALDPHQYEWNFSGSTEYGDSVSHTFLASGMNYFSVTYTNSYGCSSIVNDSIYVISSGGSGSGSGLGGGNTPGSQWDTCTVIPMSVSIDCMEAVITASELPNGPVTWYIDSIYNDNTYNRISDSVYTITFGVADTYDVVVISAANGQCYRGDTTLVVTDIYAIDIRYDCDSLVIVSDQSVHTQGMPNVTQTLYISETGMSCTFTDTTTEIPLSYFQSDVVNHVTAIFINGNDTCYVYDSVDVSRPTIDSLLVRNKMCQNVPFLFSAITTNAVSYEWNFGDGSMNYGDSVYHTYDGSTSYDIVTLNVYDEKNCSISKSKIVEIFNDILSSYILKTKYIDYVCPGTARTIEYTARNINYYYYWEYDTVAVNSYTYDTYQTGDYHVFVVDDDYGCHAERFCNVGFLNEPTARITGNTEYCYPEPVILCGNTGAGNTYQWQVTGPDGYSVNASTATLEIIPPATGSYTATLTVMSPDSCTASAALPFTVHPIPAAPTLTFCGNECIHEPPVVVCSDSNRTLFWSNGSTGVRAYYYTPGYLSAYYINSVTGCPSEKGYQFIYPAPNYDALLTGCYYKCDDDIPDTLPVYGIYPYLDNDFIWDWFFNENIEASRQETCPLLPINCFGGDYYMVSYYGNGCKSVSPTLTIEEKEICDCDSIDIYYKNVDCYTDGCKLYFVAELTIHNGSTLSRYFSQLTALGGSIVTDADSLPFYMASNSYTALTVTFVYGEFPSEYVEFVLYDERNDCEKRFTVPVNWTACVDDECKIDEFEITFNEDLSTAHQTSYYNVSLTLPNSTTGVQSFWSEPSQILDCFYNPCCNLSGLLLLNYGQLTQIADTGGKVCLHVILCLETALCHAKICIPAEKLLSMIPDVYRTVRGSLNSDSTRILRQNMFNNPDNKPYLVPNPVRTDVSVMGIAPDTVAKLVILNMDGKIISTEKNTNQITVSHLPSATYIVRVVTTDGKVYYLKLVKQ